MTSIRSRWVLPVIIFSQFTATSLWFAGNAVLDDLRIQWQLPDNTISSITSAVQLGFIFGTLTFAFFAIPDRFSPRKIFLICSIAGASANAAVTVISESYWILLGCRFMTGVFLAGLYPVGMKIAAGWYREDLGKAIGFLVGALVLGTAFPHLLKGFGSHWPWSVVMLSVSSLALLGGLILFLIVPDGPYTSKGTSFNPRALAIIFRSRDFRASAFGYFGHMWELYAFWAFVPVFLSAHLEFVGHSSLNISLWTFAIIAVGSLGCAGGGLLSQRLGSARVALYQLTASGLCCLLSPLIFFAPLPVFSVIFTLLGIDSRWRLATILCPKCCHRPKGVYRVSPHYCK